jgi:ATP-binding cassette, subfamily B, bacterial
VTAQTPSPGHGTDGQENWRGVATEDADELSTGAGVFLRARSRRLLGELLAPHKRSLWGLLFTITVQNLA